MFVRVCCVFLKLWRNLIVSKYIRFTIASIMLCMLPLLSLSPLILAQNNCSFTPFNGACGYGNCTNVKMFTCGSVSTAATCPGVQESQLAVNLFTCVPGTPTQACNPVLNAQGNAATTNCRIDYSCSWDMTSSTCVVGPQAGSCQAPYYKSATCPPPG